MPTYTVFYAKDLPNPVDLPEETFDPSAYEHMGAFEAEGLDHLYGRVQSERLSGTEQGRALIQHCLELPIHTSMTAGDIARDPGGQYWLCALRSWQPVKPAGSGEAHETSGGT